CTRIITAAFLFFQPTPVETGRETASSNGLDQINSTASKVIAVNYSCSSTDTEPPAV
ncbi:uncharacterized, partial [Tachysurus ichikawai]